MKKLLILDDSEDLLFALEQLISKYGFTVRTAVDPKTFVIELDTFKPDIVLIDVMLNVADGRRICRYIREHTEYKDLTLILFSSSAAHLKDFMEYRADAIIEKPFEIKELIEKINSAYESRTKN